MASPDTIILTAENFQTEVLQSSVPVLVDFWAEWCGPCKMIGPILDELASEYKGKAKIAKCNVDEAGELASQFRISSIPALLLFKGGKVTGQLVGAKPKKEFQKLINENL